MSRFTVLGGRGAIGKALADALRAGGHEVRAPGRDDDWRWGEQWGHAVYAVGLTADFRSRPLDTMEAHVGLLARVLRDARFESLLYLSSTRVYQRAGATREEAMLPVLPADPSDLYNLSKLAGEALCLALPRPTVRVARLANVVGADDAASENFLPSLVRAARAGRILLRTALDSEKDYVHIDDVVRLLPRMALEGRERLYNLAHGVPLRHRAWVEPIAAATRCAVDVAADAACVRFAPIDVGRIRAEFGHAPRNPLDALATLLAGAEQDQPSKGQP